MEDYTYHLGPGRGEDPRRAHARGLPDHRGGDAAACEIHPLGIGGREDPVRLVFDAAPGPGGRGRPGRPGRPVPAGGQRDRRRATRRAAAQAAGGPRGLEAAARPRDLRRGLAHRRRPAPHGAVHGRRRRGARPTSPRCPPPSWSSSTRTPRSARWSASCAGTRPTTGWPAVCEDPRDTRSAEFRPAARSSRRVAPWRRQCADPGASMPRAGPAGRRSWMPRWRCSPRWATTGLTARRGRPRRDEPGRVAAPLPEQGAPAPGRADQARRRRPLADGRTAPGRDRPAASSSPTSPSTTPATRSSWSCT